MFEALTERLNRTFRDLAGFGKLTPENVEPALREIRVALLEADVHFKVVKSFLDAVKVRALGAEVIESITPAQQFVKIVHDELARTLGEGTAEPKVIEAEKPPTVILLCGLQGSGKTTACAKLAKHLGSTALAALDLQRPAAVEQLRVLAEKIGAPFIPPAVAGDVEASARRVRAAAEPLGVRHVILDTAGRLQIDDELMNELAAVHRVAAPSETVLVLDAMVGQEAVKVAEAFRARVPLTSVLLSKTDGDARGGAALSVRFITGLPVKWIGTGESPSALEAFHPSRFAGRILGMGDVVSLVEKAARVTDQAKAEAMAKRVMKGDLDLELFLDQMREMRNMGPIGEMMALLPGASAMPADLMPSDRDITRFEAIILSMTPAERRDPDLVNVARRARIARGAGVRPEEVHRLLKQFRQARELISGMTGAGKKARRLQKMFGGLFR